MRTNLVFSRTPVSRDACSRIASSILSVVLMHIIMCYLYAFVNRVASRHVLPKTEEPITLATRPIWVNARALTTSADGRVGS